MDVSLQKTVGFLVFIGIGLLLKVKFRQKEETTGIKKIILNLALPATIFIALLSVELKKELFLLPFLALILNLLLFFIFPFLLPLCGIKKDTSEYRTASLLIPSLAPGLSAFPFILEYLGDGALAKAAMADLGNKVFVLIILYIVAMNWFYKVHGASSSLHISKIRDLLKVLIAEPVNLFIIAALILLGFGYHLENLPVVFSETLKRLSLLMTPLVLLFIGLAVSIKKGQFQKIFSMLMLRAGVVILISTLFISLGNISFGTDRLIVLAFSLSACSFWPFAHIAAIGSREQQEGRKFKTFSNTLAINILALSFPMSIILILGMFSFGNTITKLPVLVLISVSLIFFGIAPGLFQKWRYSNKKNLVEKKYRPDFKNANAEA
ncbi:permease [Christiangramia flava]|uniref:Uncharacterized protein n=1 Tax=Christiangramia flava JLT2011 TaxID=1229726 RepID=A0A1L7I593_9FLAO|nr:permease [Christiangramia flava]APU68756.1 hypothetical protein GRFL_2032 [Christiangramia flava JLT2011]OSS39099.1 hypothetical protein C723_2105 [Christiangramia flava JLT2011]